MALRFKRIFVAVIDSVGAGALPDAHLYGDEGANTLANMAQAVGGLNLPNLERLGLGNITPILGVEPQDKPAAYVTRSAELSAGKDTLTGHWEMMGLETKKPFLVFTETGFPEELIEEIKKATGRGVLGNKAASGTQIIDELGKQHMASGDLIVYTSADSVLQVAAHEKIVPPEELWDICKMIRAITMADKWRVARIIARPFIGEGAGRFTRTSNRHDYAVEPPADTVLDSLKGSGFDVIALGKIYDIFAGRGITQHEYTVSNMDGMDRLVKWTGMDFTGLVFLNLVDFDAMYGHRRNAEGYAQALEAFDARLPEVIAGLKDEDLFIITADHGNDPLHTGSDHTREYVPVILYAKTFANPRQLEILETFAAVGATVAGNFKGNRPAIGWSLLEKLT